MHFYSFSIGDYRRDTMHLSLIEHGIYRCLIDWYYLDERPIPLETDSVMRRLRLETEAEAEALRHVLNDFFVRSPEGWRHPRIDVEVADYQHMCKVNQENGKRGGRPKKTQSVNSANPIETEGEAKKTLTKNQEPLTKNQGKTKTGATPAASTASPQRGSRMSIDSLPDSWKAFCEEARPDLLPYEVFAEFSDYWRSVPGAKGLKLDWLATWRNWVRGQKKRMAIGGSMPIKTNQQRISDGNAQAIREWLGEDIGGNA